MTRRIALLLLALLGVATAPGRPLLAQSATRSDEIGAEPQASADGIARYVFAGVAVDSFQTAQWKTLSNAVNDLQGVREVLQEHYGFESPDRWVLTNSSATKDAIEELLDGLADGTDGVRPDDALVFFYAGHGTERVDSTVTGAVVRQGYLVPHDVTKPLSEARRQYLEISEIIKALSLLRAHHVLLILDSCQSGLALTADDGLKDAARDYEMTQLIEDMARNPSRLVVTSAQSDQLAADGGPFEGHSLFTGYLMDGLLRAADGGVPDSLKTERGRLVTSDLFTYVQERVARERGSRQTPTLGAFLARGEAPRGQLVFAFDVDPFDDAYVEAMDALQGRDYEGFTEAAGRALKEADEAESDENEPRAQYLRYRMASLPGAPDMGAQVAALRRLKAFADDHVAIPVDALVLEDLLGMAEERCANPKNTCPAAGG
jgi:uncharacterized caspase-like protein